MVGREPDVGPVKAAVAGFMAQFHDESICNMELVAVGTQALQELSQASRYYLPVSLQRLPGNVLRVRGAWEDVAMAVAAVHARIQAAQRQRVEAEVLYGLVKWQHLAPAGWRPFNVATNQQLETAYAEIEWDGQRSSGTGSGGWDGQRVEINLLKAMGVAPGTGAPIHLRREICLLGEEPSPFQRHLPHCPTAGHCWRGTSVGLAALGAGNRPWLLSPPGGASSHPAPEQGLGLGRLPTDRPHLSLQTDALPRTGSPWARAW